MTAAALPSGAIPIAAARLATASPSSRHSSTTRSRCRCGLRNSRPYALHCNCLPAARAQIAQSVALTSLFDCFWRMRIKSNYGTIDPYLINQTSETDHRIFSEALCTVTRAPVALLELFIIRKIGKPEFAKIATEFVAQDTHNLTARMLRARLAAYGIAL